MKKLILFGDSLFAHINKRKLLIFGEVLQDFDVYNCATGGWDTNDCVKKGEYIAKLKPDVVIISLGTNDASPRVQVAIDAYKTNIPKILDLFQGSRVIWMPPLPVDEAKTKNVGKELTNSQIKSYFDAAVEILKERNVPYIDTFAVFEPLLKAGQEYHIDDGVHLNDFAYETIAAELKKFLI